MISLGRENQGEGSVLESSNWRNPVLQPLMHFLPTSRPACALHRQYTTNVNISLEHTLHPCLSPHLYPQLSGEEHLAV